MFKRLTVVCSALLLTAACEKKPTQIAVTPANVRMDKAGSAQTLVAVGLDKEGTKLENTKVVWASSNTKVANVDATGKIIAVGSGIATVTATQENVKGSSAVMVEILSALKSEPAELKIEKAEDKPKITATVFNERNEPVAGKNATFTVADQTIATVDAAGVVTPLKDGTTTVIATFGALKAESKLEVMGMPAAPTDDKAVANKDAKAPAGKKAN